MSFCCLDISPCYLAHLKNSLTRHFLQRPRLFEVYKELSELIVVLSDCLISCFRSIVSPSKSIYTFSILPFVFCRQVFCESPKASIRYHSLSMYSLIVLPSNFDKYLKYSLKLLVLYIPHLRIFPISLQFSLAIIFFLASPTCTGT